ncbi:hypothetical protein ABFT91_18715 [Xanthomonas campestris pv. raphani]|uniref:hypothetical protein n=1 Tax=Xanthomonas campestris TaxID=339 RepID=UPI00388E0D6A
MNAMQTRHLLLVAVIASATATAQDHAHHQMHAATAVQVDSAQAVEMPAPTRVDDVDEAAVGAAASAPTISLWCCFGVCFDVGISVFSAGGHAGRATSGNGSRAHAAHRAGRACARHAAFR